MISVRSHEPDNKNYSLYWIPNDKFACMVLNAAHLLLTHGELFMCRVFNEAIPHIKDDKLLHEVKAFIGQEGSHSRAHRNVIKSYEAQGYDFSESFKLLSHFFNEVLGEKLFGKYELKKRWAFRWLKWRIGLIAVLEHITSLLGNWILENQSWEKDGAEKNMVELFKWHAAEEVEHRSVAHDLHCHLGGSRLFRLSIYFPLVLGTINIWRRATKRFINLEQSQINYSFRDYLKSAKQGHVPSTGYLTSKGIEYLAWNFHPSKFNVNDDAANILSEMEQVNVIRKLPETALRHQQ